VPRGAQVRVAQALYCTASLVNHACAPAAHASFARGGALVLRAAAPLPPGAPLSIAYGPQVGEAPAATRQRLLRTSHAFACGCDACVAPPASELQLVGLRCLASAACDGALLLPPAPRARERERERERAAPPPPARCSACGAAPPADALAAAAARARAALAALPGARDARDAPALAAALSELRATAHARNRRVAEAEDALAEALHAADDAPGALAHARAAHAILAAHYPAGSLALAHEGAKLAALAAAAGERDAAAAAADDACAAFRAHYGEAYPRLEELAPLLRPQGA
jgi:hypothetical protein